MPAVSSTLQRFVPRMVTVAPDVVAELKSEKKKEKRKRNMIAFVNVCILESFI